MKEAINLQFGTPEYEDFFGDLIRFNLESTLKDYTIKCNRLSTRADYMIGKQKISSYTYGLKHALGMEVKSQKPASLLDAQGLVKHFEYQLGTEHKEATNSKGYKWSSENNIGSSRQDFASFNGKGELHASINTAANNSIPEKQIIVK